MLFMQFLSRIRGNGTNIKKAIKNGLIVGKNFNCAPSVFIDPMHCFLICIGDDCTFTSRVHILAHDASTKNISALQKLAK